MKQRVFRSIFFTALLTALMACSLMFAVLWQRFYVAMQQRVRQEAAYVLAGYETAGLNYLEYLSGQEERVTLVSPAGNVLYDSVGDALSMENHLNRAEIAAALATGRGEASRSSATTLEQSFYCAVRCADGNIVRVVGTTDGVYSSIWACLPAVLAVAAGAAMLSAGAAKHRTEALIRPINALQLDNPLQNDVYEELTPLLARIEAQHRQIEGQMEALRRSRDEFETITGNMGEGLVLLTTAGRVLTVNRAAAAILGTQTDTAPERDMLELERGQAMREALDAAGAGKSAAGRLERGGRIYRLSASPVFSGGEVAGIVVLLLDRTAETAAEDRRREFTATVSHELKTPLQTILGSAELLAEGMVKPEDTQAFAGRIHREAGRLLTLVQDILRLASLDEGAPMERENVDLQALTRRVAEELAQTAKTAGVTLTVTGQPAPVKGAPTLLYEIVHNLCENAVKYNRPGGWVRAETAAQNGQVRLTVQDGGLGIPEDSQPRVFERFFRVDKSHSRSTGGTGLGLSIVKHAVQYHGGTITLSSRPEEGTVITVILPDGQGKTSAAPLSPGQTGATQ